MDDLAPRTPNWLRLWTAIASTIVAFRLSSMALRYLLVLPSGPSWLVGFLYRHADPLVFLLGIAAAVVAARHAEAWISLHARRVALVACVLLSALALVPARMEVFYGVAMASPVEIAIRRGFPLDTIDRLLERYPHLAQRTAHRGPGGMYYDCPLASAAYEDKTNVVRLLIRRGAKVDDAVEELVSLETTNALNLVLDCANLEKQATGVAPLTGTGSQP